MAIGGQQVTIVVDVANVMGSRPDGWWRDRVGAAIRLHTEIVQLARSGRAILPASPYLDESRPDSSDPSGSSPYASDRGEPALGGSGAGGSGAGGSGAAPGFVMVLEGAAKAAAARLAAAEPDADADADAEVDVGVGVGRSGPVRPGEVRVVQARGSGDDTIVAVVRELPGRRVVVTADRELRARCAAAGAEILGPGWLLGLLRG